jgi:two-component system, cell cycle sensor histidine kinase and response regulator CckA
MSVMAAPPRGSETVLLVEPEPETRTLAVFMLSKQGYRVLEARDAPEATRLYEEHGSTIDLLFTEALMPRGNGPELAQALAARNPRLKVLYLSDRQYARISARLASPRGSAFLPRPFTMGILAAKVREVLDRPQLHVLTAGG